VTGGMIFSHVIVDVKVRFVRVDDATKYLLTCTAVRQDLSVDVHNVVRCCVTDVMDTVSCT